MIFSMGFVVILQVIQVILPRQTLRAIHRDQRQQRAVDASRLSCDHERTPRTAKMMVIGSRRIPPDTLLTKSIHSNIPVTLGLNMYYIYIYTGIVSSMQMGLESTDEVGGSAHYKVSSKHIGSYRADPVE